MWKIGLVVDPGLYLYRRIVHIDELLGMNDNKSHIYYMLGTKKVGQTSNGRVRTANYKTEKDDNPILHSIIDLDHIPFNIQPELTQRILNLAKMFLPDEYPTMLRDVLHLDKYGLPASLQLHLRSLVMSAEECMNGVFSKLSSALSSKLVRRFHVSLKNQRIIITGDVHDASRNDSTRLVANLNEEVYNDISNFFMHAFTDEEKQFVRKNSIIPIAVVYNLRKPHPLTSTPEKCVGATEAIMATIVQDVR